MNYGPSSPLYLPRITQIDVLATEQALLAILGTTEANWLHSQGVKLFRVDLSGVVDNEKKVDRYLKVRK